MEFGTLGTGLLILMVVVIVVIMWDGLKEGIKEFFNKGKDR